ncbi:MAG: hypothetical protein ACXVJD_05695 [Mucilaginibacter sp.]
MKTFLLKFNLRLLIIHFVAFWFFIYAFRTLSFLHDFGFLVTAPIEVRLNETERLNFDREIAAQASLLGLVIAYIISWLISLKRDWFWLNSLAVFILMYALKYYNLLGWNILQNVFLLTCHVVGQNTRAFYIVNGAIMLGLGCLLLFSGKIKRFIDGGGPAKKKPGAHRKTKPAKR